VLIGDLRARGGVDLMWENADGAPIGVGLDTVVAGGNVSVAGNSGQFQVQMFQVASGGSIGIQGNFLTEVDAETLLARGSLNVDFGPGLLSLDLNNGVFGGNLNVSGAGGVELMEITDTRMRGNANINTGDGSVQALLTSLLVGGSMNVTNGAGAIAQYVILGTTVRGNLNVQSNALYTGMEVIVKVGGNLNMQTGLGGDDIWLHHSTVRGRTTVNTDGGNDQFILGNSLLNGNFLIDTGAGEDWVSLAHDGSDSFGSPLVFNSSVTVRTQGDNDLVEVGLSANPGDTAEFYGPVFMDGGSGIDAVFLGGFNTYTQVPTFISFEIV
jgi:hypothetical protein